MTKNKPQKIRENFILYENKNWKYKIDVISRKRYYVLEVNWKIVPISKQVIESYIITQANNYIINLNFIWNINSYIEADTCELLIIKILKELVKYLQKQEILNMELSNTLERINMKHNKILNNN